jgi:hypothetical protein
MGQIVRQVPVTTSSSGGLRVGVGALGVTNQRKSFSIQNQKAEVLYVKLGTGATASDYHYVLSACGSVVDGSGGSLSIDNYTGAVSVKAFSSIPSYTMVEFI